MKKIIFFAVIALAIGSFFLSNINKASAVKPSDYGLKEGDLISAIFSDDPDVYIINDSGYKRLFLNPEIFKFYGHLGGFFNIKLVTPEVRDSFVTSGLFRDCESNDQKVYGVDISGEDSGQLHWVNTSGAQAVVDDPNFFKKVFCINSAEFNWYPKGNALGTVNDVPDYERKSTSTATTPAETVMANSSLKNVGQVVICHYPPEAPNKFQEITIDASALKAHLEHRDIIGACPSVPPAVACTTEAKLCSDGLYVSRSGPNCEFSTCSVPKPTCLPRPACLDTTPRCLPPEPIGGWCPTQTPVPTPTWVPTPTPVPTPITSTSITVVYPNGGEILQKGTPQIIKWNSVGISKIYIKLRKGSDTYSMPEGMITDVIPNVGGYYQWTVPTTLPDGNDYAVRIVDGNYTGGYDDSDSLFSIGTTTIQTPTPTPSVSATPTPTPIPAISILDATPRIMYWWGKVNQHVDVYGNWLTDPDGISGADLDKLTYCKKFYPNTVGVVDYMLETTNTWLNRGNVDGPFTSIKMSTKCLQSSVSPTPTPTPIYLPAPTGLKVGFGIGSGVNNWVKAEESLSFNFDIGNLSNVSAFRLYQKRPQDTAFSVVGEFSNPSSLNLCYLTRTYGTWNLAPIGGPNCPGSAWHISRTSLYPVSNYAIGDYLYYVKALDASGTEGPASITGTSTFLGTFPITVETSGTLNPTFRWQAVSSWSQPLAYWVMVAPSDGTGSQQMLTAVTSSGPSVSKVYDGTALIPGKQYSVWAYGRSHNSDQSEDRMSFASGMVTFSVTSIPTPTPISCAPITVSLSPATPQLQNASPGQSGVSLVIFNIATNCNLNLNSFAVSLLPMPNGYQNISSLRLYNNVTGAQLGSTVTASVAGLNFTGVNQPILANQTLSLKVVGDISPTAVIGSTVYGVFGGSSAIDTTTGNFVGNNASGNIIAGNVITIVAPMTNLNQSNNLAIFSRNLTIGSTGDDVKQLQALLVNEVGYSTDLITGYFGRITRDAVAKLQEKYGIKPIYGYFGEITRKALSALISGQ